MRTDEQIRDDIIEEIKWEPQIESTEVGVTVKDGAVSLLGTVGSYAEKLAAERAARRVKGVLAIAEEILVKYPREKSVKDEDIAERIAHVLEWNISLDRQDIQARVRNGFVTLTGVVDWHYQRENARRHVARVRGVAGVSNMITLKTRVAKTDLKKDILQALHRYADLEMSHIDLGISGGRVTITGDVHAWSERKLIEDAVWSSPGVTEVIDNLRVT